MPDPFYQIAQALNGSNTPPNAPITNWNKGGRAKPHWISVHHYTQLIQRLPDTVGLDYIPIRVASGTCVLIKSPNQNVQADFFTSSSSLFPQGIDRKRFFSEASEVDLLAFSLTKDTFGEEQNLTNLLVASGVLHRALGIERPFSLVMPATSKSGGNIQFNLKNPNGNDYTVNSNTQIEIDLVLSGFKEGRAKLYVIEAKTKRFDDIVNWKFLYPAKLVKDGIDFDVDVDVIPTYLSVNLQGGMIEFDIATFPAVTQDAIDIINPTPTKAIKGCMKWS
jgi:hypothetical protein